MFRAQNLCPGSKIVFDSRQKQIFNFRAAKFVSATHVYRAAKLGNICIRNNVSATMFPSLARPLVLTVLNLCEDFDLGDLSRHRTLNNTVKLRTVPTN